MRFADADLSGLDGVYVLVVEDSDDSREALRRILEHCGALVTAARLLALLRPHVLVTDVGMPGQAAGRDGALSRGTATHDSEVRHHHSARRRLVERGARGARGCPPGSQAPEAQVSDAEAREEVAQGKDGGGVCTGADRGQESGSNSPAC